MRTLAEVLQFFIQRRSSNRGRTLFWVSWGSVWTASLQVQEQSKSWAEVSPLVEGLLQPPTAYCRITMPDGRVCLWFEAAQGSGTSQVAVTVVAGHGQTSAQRLPTRSSIRMQVTHVPLPALDAAM